MYFSARSASWAPLLFQQITRCHSVFSCFSPPCPVHCRLVARDNVATREPLLVLRTSGSARKFPISMTLLRLRLTTDLQTLGGSGPRATTVYDPQVILSIKDTPLVLKFCRPPLRSNGSPQNHRVLDRAPVVTRPARDLAKAERLVQLPGRRVGCPHFEIHRADAPPGKFLEHALDQRATDPLASMCRRDAQIEDFSLVGGAVRDDVAGDHALPFGHEERYARRDALREIIRRPGIGERTTVTRLPSGLRFRRTSVHRLRGDRVLDGATGACAVHEREEQGRPGWEALGRHRSGPDPAGDCLGVAYGSVTHDHAGTHWRDAHQLRQ